MSRAKSGLLTGLLLSLLAAGCQNKMYDENKQLYDENKALRDQNDRLKQQEAMGAQAPAQPVMPATAVAVNPAPTEPPPPPPLKTNAAPSHRNVQVGDLETNVNPQTGHTTVYLPSKLLFAPGQATLQPDAKKSLDQVVSALKRQFAGKKLRVEGHTDKTPIKVSKWSSNEELSLARADAVKQYLVAHGISAGRITTRGFGSAKPRDPNELARNRRVEIVVLTGPMASGE